MKREWNHNIEYHQAVLAAMPNSCASALDIGCGDGQLTLKLASHCAEVTGIDLDPDMIAQASKHEHANATFTTGDILIHPFPPASFTFIVSIATLHHLPLEAALTRFADLLAPGGTLAIIGLYRPQSLTDAAFHTAGFLASHIKRRFHDFQPMTAPMQPPQQTFEEIREAAARILPGSRLQRRLFFRYSLIWKKLPTA